MNRHHAFLFALVLSAASGSLLAEAPQVAAHELGVVVVAPPGSEVRDAVPDGFRLAVDQSPDVSHPPATEAGDHLGGIDVDLTTVRLRDSRDVVARVSRAVSGGSRVVVLLRGSRTAVDERLSADILARMRTSNPLIVVAGTRASLPAALPLPVVLLRDRPRSRIDPARAARFEREFSRRYRRAPDRAARNAYDAGRLLDRLLARLGEGPFGSVEIAGAVPGANRALIAGTADMVPAPRQVADPSAKPSDNPSRRTTVVAVVAAGVITALIAGWASRRIRGRRRYVRP